MNLLRLLWSFVRRPGDWLDLFDQVDAIYDVIGEEREEQKSNCHRTMWG